MKTRLLFMTFAFVVTIAGTVQAQKKDVSVYGFAYSTYKAYEYKDVYFSGVVNATKNSNEYQDPVRNALGNQWYEKTKMLFDDYYKLNWTEYAWFESFEEVDRYRTKLIGEFKSKGFVIHYIDNFYFRKSKK